MWISTRELFMFSEITYRIRYIQYFFWYIRSHARVYAHLSTNSAEGVSFVILWHVLCLLGATENIYYTSLPLQRHRSIPPVMCMRIRSDWIYYRVLSTQCDDEKHHLPRFLLFFAVFFFLSEKCEKHRQGQMSASDNGDDVDSISKVRAYTMRIINIYVYTFT